MPRYKVEKCTYYDACSKKDEWYISRGLANPIGDNDFKLTFEPKGKGKSNSCSFYHNPIENKCVVCGQTETLTQHHVVPRCYRTHFPEEYKSRNSYDVLILCCNHHEEYESIAKIYHENIFNTFGITPPNIKQETTIKYIQKIILNIRNWKHKMAVDRLNKYLNQLSQYYNRKIVLEEVEWLPLPTYDEIESDNRYKNLVSKISNIEEFIIGWRNHFVHTMKPQHLPVGWLENKDIVEKS